MHIYCQFVLPIIFLGDFTATMNAHLLSHIPECVSKWGPLWAYSCFPFEGMNHALKLLFHGTRDMSYEVNANFYDLHTNIDPV